MAKHRRRPYSKDAPRIARKGTGKLDRGSAHGEMPRIPTARASAPPSPADSRARLERERQAAVAQLQQLRISPEFDERVARGPDDGVVEEGDAAQSSERQDMAFAQRERLAARINRLTAALERLTSGRYGHCEVCGREIEPARLAAVPEAATCRECQERLERSGQEPAA
jgi:RNA polymerase-binding transcription factor DksA